MALNNMAIEPAVHEHTAFDIYFGGFGPGGEICFEEGFFDGCYLVLITVEGFNGKTNAIMAYALVDL